MRRPRARAQDKKQKNKKKETLALEESQVKQHNFMNSIGKLLPRNNCGKKMYFGKLRAGVTPCTPVNYCWAASTKQLKSY